MLLSDFCVYVVDVANLLHLDVREGIKEFQDHAVSPSKARLHIVLPSAATFPRRERVVLQLKR